MKKYQQSRSFFIGSNILLLPAVAFAAEVARSLEGDVTTRGFWLAFLAVQVLTACGYMASSLPKWAGWRDGAQMIRLQLIAGCIAAVLAGNIGYYTGMYYWLLPQIGCLVSAIGGGFMGEKALAFYFERFVGKPFTAVEQTTVPSPEQKT